MPANALAAGAVLPKLAFQVAYCAAPMAPLFGSLGRVPAGTAEARLRFAT